MKSILALTAIAFGMGLNAHAATADQMSLIVKCTRAVPMADNGLTIEVEQGGFAGLTQLHISRSYFSKVLVKNYIVKEIVQHVANAPVVFEGQEARLTVDFTTAPDKNGGHVGTLQTNDGSGTDEVLSCQAL